MCSLLKFTTEQRKWYYLEACWSLPTDWTLKNNRKIDQFYIILLQFSQCLLEEKWSRTFRSELNGSMQFYAVAICCQQNC